MIPTPPRTRKLFHSGKIGPRTRCAERAHLGPLNPAEPRFAGWLGCEWAHCAACGSTITVGKVAA